MVDQILSTIASWIVEVISAGGYLGVVGLMAIESGMHSATVRSDHAFCRLPRLHRPIQPARRRDDGRAWLQCRVDPGLFRSGQGWPAGDRTLGPIRVHGSGQTDRTENFFARYGTLTVFVGRLLPVVRTFIAFPAGLARMPMMKFQIYTFLGSWPWCFALAYVGFVLGQRWDSDPTFRRLFHQFDTAVAIVLLVGFIWFVWSRLRES